MDREWEMGTHTLKRETRLEVVRFQRQIRFSAPAHMPPEQLPEASPQRSCPYRQKIDNPDEIYRLIPLHGHNPELAFDRWRNTVSTGPPPFASDDYKFLPCLFPLISSSLCLIAAFIYLFLNQLLAIYQTKNALTNLMHL